MQTRATTSTALALLAIAAAALVVSSGAAIIDQPTDRIDDEVALAPGDNPYTDLDENDELVIDVSEENPEMEGDGVKLRALTAADALFYVTYDGENYADVWITHESAAVTFVADGEPVESEDDALRVSPADETVPVGVSVDTRVAEYEPGTDLIDGISVHATPADGPPPEDPGEPGAGDDTDPSGAHEPATSVEAPTPDERVVAVRNAAGGSVTEVALDRLQIGDGIRLLEADVVRQGAGDVGFTVEGSDEASAFADVDPPGMPGVDPLAYYRVEPVETEEIAVDDEEPVPVSEATVTVEVDRDRLDAAGVDPEDVGAYRVADAEADDGTWDGLETRVVTEDADAVRIAVDSDGFSAFALAGHHPAFAAVDATPSPAEVVTGEEVDIEVDVKNAGPTGGEGPVTLLADGEPVTDVEIDADPGESATVAGTVSFDEPGEYAVSVAGEAVVDEETLTTVEVVEEGDPSGTQAPPAESVEDAETPGAVEDAEVEEPGGLTMESLAGVVALLAIVLATLLLVRRMPR